MVSSRSNRLSWDLICQRTRLNFFRVRRWKNSLLKIARRWWDKEIKGSLSCQWLDSTKFKSKFSKTFCKKCWIVKNLKFNQQPQSKPSNLSAIEWLIRSFAFYTWKNFLQKMTALLSSTKSTWMPHKTWAQGQQKKAILACFWGATSSNAINLSSKTTLDSSKIWSWRKKMKSSTIGTTQDKINSWWSSKCQGGSISSHSRCS